MARIWWRIAWRNLWRNRARTVVTASALSFGFIAAVLMVGVSDGMLAEMVSNGTGVLTGQVQLHAPGYVDKPSLYTTVGGDSGTDVSALLARIDSVPGVVAAAPRVLGGALVSLGEHTAGASVMGVDPVLERGVSRLLPSISEGRAPRPGTREVALGVELARRLKARVGDQVVLVAPAADGSLGNDLYTVSGIFDTGLPDLDRGVAIVPLGTLQALLALGPNRIHEVAVAVGDPWSAPVVAAAVSARLRAAGIPAQVRPWTTFRPELADYAQLGGAANALITGIVFTMAVFGVANTMVMGTYERRREFAVVRALGTSRVGIARTVLYEGVILGLLALVAGAAMGAPLLMWLHDAPPSLSWLFGGFTMAGALVPPVLRVEYSVHAPVASAVALLITSLVAAVLPAWRASRVPPADALAGR